MKADPQKQDVYRMEHREFRGVWKHVDQPLRYLRKMSDQVCDMYSVPRIPVEFGKVRGGSAEYIVGSQITLDEKGQQLFTLAHELAHHIVWCRYGHRAQDHGPMFVFVYAQVLSSLRIVPMAGMRAACRRNGVKMAAQPKRRRRAS